MKRILFFMAIMVLTVGCQRGGEYEKAAEIDMVLDTTANADTLLVSKVVKTTDMRFKVKDVQKAKEQLTAAVNAQGGTVAEFNIQSIVQETDKVKYTLDSLKEITSYRKEGMLVAKVPSDRLDDFTNLAVHMSVFVDHQSMKLDDQSIAYLGNKLKLKNRESALKSMHQTAAKKGNNVETSLYIGDDYVDKKTENINLNEKVKFSTITFSFYQENAVQTVVIANDRIQDYGPGFFKQVGLNMVAGWTFFKAFVLLLIGFWPAFLLGLLTYFAIRFYKRKKLVRSVQS